MQAKFWFLMLTVIVTMAGVLFLISHGQSQPAIKVNLGEKSAVSQIQTGSSFDSEPADNLLRVAIAGALSPSLTLEYYQELLTYIGQQMGRQVTLLQKPTYAEINDLVRGRRVDMAFVCSLPYLEGKEDFGMELLVAPQMYGKTIYYSYLVVPKESSATGLDDLRGASFAFTDPGSNSGHLAPTYQLFLLGETPASFFSRYTYTYNHDNSVVAVADGLVDGAAVNSLVYDQLVADNPELASKTRVIARWGPYGIPPLVVSPSLDPQFKQELQDLLVNLHNSDEGAAILGNLAIDKFVVVADDIYSSIREMKEQLGW